MDQELTKAADAGNSEKLREILTILNFGAAKEEDWLRKTLLRATYENRHQAVTALLAVKASHAWTDQRGEAPLHWASRQGHRNVVQQLLRHRAAVGQQTPDGSSALHLASMANVGPIVQLLLERRADPCLETRDKRVALHMAAEHGSTTSAAVLLEPDPIYDDIPNPALEIRNVSEETPLCRAAARGHAAVAQLLLRAKADPHVRNWWGQGSLQLASHGGHVAAAQVLIDKDADVNAKANDGTTPLHTAAERGQAKVVEILLAQGAFSDRRSQGGRTALHAAAEKGSVAAITALLQHGGLSIEDRTEQGRTALTHAAGRGHVAAVRLLLEREADPQSVDTVRQSAIHAAAATGQADVIEVLVDKRSRIDAQDAAGRTAIQIAHQAQQESAVRALLKCGAIMPDEILKAEDMKSVVREVERERLTELVKENETGKAHSAMQVAEREFENARQRLVTLTTQNQIQRSAPAIHVLEVQLAEVMSITKTAKEAEEKMRIQVDGMNSTLTKIEKQTAIVEKDMKWYKNEGDKMKQSYLKKMRQISEMKKEANEARANAKKDQIRAETLDSAFAESQKKLDFLTEQLALFLKEGDAAEENLQEVMSKLEVWHQRKREAARLHQKAQDLLSRERTEPVSTPRT